MPTITYFGELVTTGNATINQNFTTQGAFMLFSSNLVPSVSGTGDIGAGTPIANAWFTTANVTVTSVPSIRANIANSFPNLIVSNSITTTNIVATTLNTYQSVSTSMIVRTGVGVGADPGPWALYVNGNVYVSNALQSPNVNAFTMNVTTSNIGSLNVISNVSSLVTGNIAVANAVSVTNVIVTAATTSALNAATINTVSLIYDTLSTGNITLTGNIYYGEDATKRYIHLVPSASNASAIKMALAVQSNAMTQPGGTWWSVSQAPTFANISSLTSSNALYSGSVLVPGDEVLFVPGSEGYVGMYNPKTEEFSEISGLGTPLSGFSSGVLLPTGNVFFVPKTSNAGLYNPVAQTYSNVAIKGPFTSGILTSNGIQLIPSGVPSNVLNYNFSTGAVTNALTLRSVSFTPAITNVAMSASQNWSSAVWSPELGIFVAVAGNYNLTSTVAATSPDGVTWTARTMPGTATYWSSVTWSPELGIFCAVAGAIQTAQSGARNTTRAATSPDGINWTSVTLPTSAAWTCITWSPDLGIFLVISGLSNGASLTSPDGVTWTPGTGMNIGGTTSDKYTSVCWSPQLGLFVASFGCQGGADRGNSSQDVTSFIVTSPDGINWTIRSIGIDSWPCVTWSPELGVFCAVGGGSSLRGAGSFFGAVFRSVNVATSVDGVTWTTSPVLPAADYWSHVSWSSQLGMFLAVAGGGDQRSSNAAVSKNGSVWTSVTPSNTWYWSHTTWSPNTGRFLVLGGNKNSELLSTPTANTLTLTRVAKTSSGATLLPTGNVIFKMPGESNIIQFNYTSLAASNITVGTDGYSGMMLTPSGNVVGVPATGNVLSLNPETGTASNVRVTGGNVTSLFSSGVTLPYGNVVFVPGISANVGMFDSATLTYSNSTPVGRAGLNFMSGTLVPSGQVVFAPWDSQNVAVLNTLTPSTREICLSPYFNKF